MPEWKWLLVGVGATLALYAAFVLFLVMLGRREHARALAGLIPDCIVLVRRLLRDPDVRLSRGRKLLLAALIGYLAMPFDLVPDAIPVAGQLDDAVVVALALRVVLRGVGPDAVRTHWPGPPSSLSLVLRLASGRGPTMER